MPRVNPEDARFTLAINLHDLHALPPDVRKSLLSGRVSTASVVWPLGEDAPEHAAVVFTCSIESAARVCDAIRNYNRLMECDEARVYLRIEGENWEEIEGGRVFLIHSKSHRDQQILNPSIFTSSVIELSPPVPKRIVI